MASANVSTACAAMRLRMLVSLIQMANTTEKKKRRDSTDDSSQLTKRRYTQLFRETVVFAPDLGLHRMRDARYYTRARMCARALLMLRHRFTVWLGCRRKNNLSHIFWASKARIHNMRHRSHFVCIRERYTNATHFQQF